MVLLVGTAIMWLIGRSYFLRGRLEAGEFNEAWLSLVGKTRLMEILVPMPFLILLALAIAVSIFLNATVYGRYLFALGRNEQAARVQRHQYRCDDYSGLSPVRCRDRSGRDSVHVGNQYRAAVESRQHV